ncbi:MAG: esterase-like activity of phytase family protein [Cytophagales bacterium]|nr:esterase-like activity of phytase family protein [Cytophagales bacterium]
MKTLPFFALILALALVAMVASLGSCRRPETNNRTNRTESAASAPRDAPGNDALELDTLFAIRREALAPSGIMIASASLFGLSGFARNKGGSIYAVFDNLADNTQRVYQIDARGNFVQPTQFPLLPLSQLEGIDVDGEGRFYLVSEDENRLITYAPHPESPAQVITLKYAPELYAQGWCNGGLEGIAVDPTEPNTVYLAKERSGKNDCAHLGPPGTRVDRGAYSRYLLKVDLRNPGQEITYRQHAFLTAAATDETSDYADLKMDTIGDKKYLYVLERLPDRITKVDVTDPDHTRARVVGQYSFGHITRNAAGEQCLYNTNLKYGLAEALLLTEDRIWIGLDNNGRAAKGMLAEKGVGTDPVVLVFKRPPGF